MELVIGAVVVLILLVVGFQSINQIGPTQVGLVTKRFGLKKLKNDSPIAFMP